MMERITITITPRMAAKLRREARRRHITVSKVVREHLDDDDSDGAEVGAPERVIAWAGVGASGNPKLANEMDTELDRSWANDLRQGRR